jgi:hypothetical protein
MIIIHMTRMILIHMTHMILIHMTHMILIHMTHMILIHMTHMIFIHMTHMILIHTVHDVPTIIPSLHSHASWYMIHGDAINPPHHSQPPKSLAAPNRALELLFPAS